MGQRGSSARTDREEPLIRALRGSVGKESNKGQPRKEGSASGTTKQLWTHTARSSVGKKYAFEASFLSTWILSFFTTAAFLNNHTAPHALSRLFLSSQYCALLCPWHLDMKFTGTCYIMETGGRGMAALGICDPNWSQGQFCSNCHLDAWGSSVDISCDESLLAPIYGVTSKTEWVNVSALLRLVSEIWVQSSLVLCCPIVATCHVWLLRTWNVAEMTEKLNFLFNRNFHLDNSPFTAESSLGQYYP